MSQWSRMKSWAALQGVGLVLMTGLLSACEMGVGTEVPSLTLIGRVSIGGAPYAGPGTFKMNIMGQNHTLSNGDWKWTVDQQFSVDVPTTANADGEFVVFKDLKAHFYDYRYGEPCPGDRAYCTEPVYLNQRIDTDYFFYSSELTLSAIRFAVDGMEIPGKISNTDWETGTVTIEFAMKSSLPDAGTDRGAESGSVPQTP